MMRKSIQVKPKRTQDQVKEIVSDVLKCDVDVEKNYDYYHVSNIRIQDERNDYITFEQLKEISDKLETKFIDIRNMEFEKTTCSCDTCTVVNLIDLCLVIWWEEIRRYS